MRWLSPPDRVAEAREGSQEEARRDLKLFFVMEQAAKQLEIEVTDRAVNGQIAMMAMQQGRRPEKLRQEMARSGQLETLYGNMRQQKTLDAILEKAKVTESEPEADAKPEAKDKPEDKPKPKDKPEAKPKPKDKPEAKPKPKDKPKEEAKE